MRGKERSRARPERSVRQRGAKKRFAVFSSRREGASRECRMPRRPRHRGENNLNVAPPKSLVDLFTGFLMIGARSFGGVLPWAYRTLVEERRWMTHADFTETIGLCQFLPGPNIGNASIVLGKRWFGLRGAIVAFLGLMALPFVW